MDEVTTSFSAKLRFGSFLVEKVLWGPVDGPGRRVEFTGPREAARGALPG